MSSPTTTTTNIIIPTTTPQDIPTTTSEPYCCKSKGLWSLDKKHWCCQHYGVGCPTTPKPTPPPTPPPPTPPPEPNCALGAPLTWDMGKKVWCCAHHHIGCPTVPPPPPPAPTTTRARMIALRASRIGRRAGLRARRLS